MVLRRKLSVLLAAVMLLAMTLASSSVALAAHYENGYGQHSGGGDAAHQQDRGNHQGHGGGRLNNKHVGCLIC